MRAVRLVRHQSAAMERSSGADATRNGGTGSEDQRPAHTISLSSDLLLSVDLALCVQEGNKCRGVLLRGARRGDASHELTKSRHVVRVLEAERFGIEVQ